MRWPRCERIVETLLKKSFCAKRQKPPDVGGGYHLGRHIRGFVARKVTGMVIHFSYSTVYLSGVLFSISLAWPSVPGIVSALPDHLQFLMDSLRSDSWPSAITPFFPDSIVSLFLILGLTLSFFPFSFPLCSFPTWDRCIIRTGSKLPGQNPRFISSQQRGNGEIMAVQHTGPRPERRLECTGRTG